MVPQRSALPECEKGRPTQSHIRNPLYRHVGDRRFGLLFQCRVCEGCLGTPFLGTPAAARCRVSPRSLWVGPGNLLLAARLFPLVVGCPAAGCARAALFVQQWFLRPRQHTRTGQRPTQAAKTTGLRTLPQKGKTQKASVETCCRRCRFLWGWLLKLKLCVSK